MSWEAIYGHDEIVERFRRALTRRRLASTFLFVGPAGVGKMKFARELAKALLCERHDEAELTACDQCPACRQVAAGSHPDLFVVAKPDDKSVIPIDLLIGDVEHRRREGLCHDIALKAFRGGRRIAIIDDADFLNQEGANCLLKTLEEPPPNSVIILISASEQKQLPTIRSRCQVIRFRPLSEQAVAEILVSRDDVAGPQETRRIAERSGGSVARAFELADAESAEFRQTLRAHFDNPNWNPQQLVGAISSHVDAAGKDATARRTRLVQVVNQAADYFREAMLTASRAGGESETGAALRQAAWTNDPLRAAECVDRCLDAQAHVHANANQATLIECWIDDLASLTRV